MHVHPPDRDGDDHRVLATEAVTTEMRAIGSGHRPIIDHPRFDRDRARKLLFIVIGMVAALAVYLAWTSSQDDDPATDGAQPVAPLSSDDPGQDNEVVTMDDISTTSTPEATPAPTPTTAAPSTTASSSTSTTAASTTTEAPTTTTTEPTTTTLVDEGTRLSLNQTGVSNPDLRITFATCRYNDEGNGGTVRIRLQEKGGSGIEVAQAYYLADDGNLVETGNNGMVPLTVTDDSTTIDFLLVVDWVKWGNGTDIVDEGRTIIDAATMAELFANDGEPCR